MTLEGTLLCCGNQVPARRKRMLLPDFVGGTTAEQAHARRVRDELVARVSGGADQLPRPVRLVLRGLTDPGWWIAHEHGLVDELVGRLGPYANVLTAGGVRRRALCIGVGSFARPGDGGDEELELTGWAALPYAERCAGELRQALTAAGYEVSVVTDAARLSASMLGDWVGNLLADNGVEVAVVHVLSHGELRP